MGDGETNADDRRLRGVEMDRAEIDSFLREQGIGTLSLADGSEAYGVPVSFGYDDGTLYFFLVRFGEDSAKIDFAEATTTASFTAYSFADEHRWRSVVASGPIERVPESDLEAAEAALSANASFASLYPYGEPMTERPRYRLTVDSVTGQKGQGYDR
jgi:nitroimidazol reductase NimA-like FMN-containing flavoprotein (pyridoxamine 5'-phosphate oxidase superfamily)